MAKKRQSEERAKARKEERAIRKREEGKEKSDQSDAFILLFQEYYRQKRCEVCQQASDESFLLLCDRCDDSYHIFCLDPPLEGIPDNDWVCPICQCQLKQLTQLRQKIKREVELICFKCKKGLNKFEAIRCEDEVGQEFEVECQSLNDIRCLYCSKIFHNSCFSERKNSLNCFCCEKKIRREGPKSHDQFLEYINRCNEAVGESNFECLKNAEQVDDKRLRCFHLKVPQHMTYWQLITQHQASVYYALTTKRITFVDEQIYHKQDKALMTMNRPDKDLNGVIKRLHERDQTTFEQFKQNSRMGYVGPFEVKESRTKGFYLIATDFIEANTIVSEYSGEVMTARNALNEEENDSIFLLMRSARASQSLDLVPTKYGNISRFFSGINNEWNRRQTKRLQNIKVIRFSYKGRIRLLLYTARPIQAGETLYFNYNGSYYEYPTENFVE